MTDISIIFVSYNTAEMTKKAINLVKESLHQLKLEIFVIDNASRDDSAGLVASEFPEVKLIVNDVNVGFGRANNQVLSMVTGTYVLLLNTDAFVEPDTIQKTYDFMQANPRTGVLGVKLLGRDGLLQPSCRYFPTPWNIFLNRTGLNKLFPQAKMVDDMAWDHASVRDCDWVPGCYYLIRKEVIDQVGLFDPRYFLYYEEVDHCFATKAAGWHVTYFPETTVIHIGGESAKTDSKISSVSKQVGFLQIESEILFFKKNLNFICFVSYVLLFFLADFLMLMKSTTKSLTFGDVRNYKSALPLFVKILIKTRFGLKPIH